MRHNKLDRVAIRLGSERGRNSASWAGIDSDSAPIIMRQYDDGDPVLFDAHTGPLSGEWAGDPTPSSLLREITSRSLSPERGDELCTLYEQAYDDAYWAEIVRQCQYHLAA